MNKQNNTPLKEKEGCATCRGESFMCIKTEDVKQAVKELKEGIINTGLEPTEWLFPLIDKIFGFGDEDEA